ncbi:MAG: Rpn family recombination-promoting nuclease/putative transposase [Lachnospiraceae bacterium]|nr:Rpn family recombination-promoting nuclease/putative transposase [Lachnospiraceae bacterium]
MCMTKVTSASQTINYDLLPVTSDIVFKMIFGQEDSKPILCSFLNAILHLDIQSPDQLELSNTEINPDYLDDKKCILDIKIKLPDKTSIDVEIQVVNQYNIDRRSVYYVAQLCADQLNSGDNYSLLRPSIGLTIICFNFFEDDRYHRRIVLKDNDTGEFFSDMIRIEFLEIAKAIKTLSHKADPENPISSDLTEAEQWALFIGSDRQEVFEMLASNNKSIEEAYARLQRFSCDETLREQYRAREKALRDWNSSISSSYSAGMEKGKTIANDSSARNLVAYLKSQNTTEEKIIEQLMFTYQLSHEQAAVYLSNE